MPGSAYAGKQATYAWFQRTLRRPEEFVRLAAEAAPDVDVRLLMPGEALNFAAPADDDAPDRRSGGDDEPQHLSPATPQPGGPAG